MKVLFATAEVDPFSKVGGLADVAASLPARLREIGHDVLGEDPEIFETHGDLPRSDPELAPSLRPILVPATLSKGLEFDHVVLLEPADIVAGEPDEVTGLRRLYVCLTRAVTSLIVVYASDLPAALAA